MPALTLDSVRKHYGVKPLLDDVSFSLEDGGKMGVIGANGSGKTTLLRIIAGVEPPDSGTVQRPSAHTVGYLAQEPAFAPGQTVLDAVFAGDGPAMRLLRDYEAALRRLEASDGTGEALAARVADLSHRLDAAGGWDLETSARAVLDRLGIADTEAPVDALSGGQRKRVALARALVEQPDLLILDEPTNHLDAETVGWLEATLRRYTGALLLVTHDRYFLDRAVDWMLEIDRGTAQRFEGNYTKYLEAKAAQAEVRAAEQRTRDNLARRELAWLRRGAKARTTKQKARVQRAHDLLSAPREEAERTAEISAVSSRLGKKVIELDGVTKGWEGQTLINDFSYSFTRTDRVGIIGPNGSGKTTLLEMIAGRLAPDAGQVEVGPTVSIGYYDQESRALKDDLRLIDYIEEVAENVKTADGSVITASQMLDRFLFPPKQQYTPVGLLSGGERRRLYLLRVLMGAPNVLLLDEPTNDLDIPTLVSLEDYLDTFPGALITVSHDRYFLDRTAGHLFRFEPGGHLREIPGSYSAWLEIKEQEEAEAARIAAAARKSAPPAEAPAPKPATAPGKKLSFNEKRELDETEARIEAAEARQAEIEAALAASPSDYEQVAALSAELETLAAQLERDVDRWADLAERA
ncbi:MAG: ABC-F family ATP-binding cassette domain-containing protein [Bacteroidota bacterium]